MDTLDDPISRFMGRHGARLPLVSDGQAHTATVRLGQAVGKAVSDAGLPGSAARLYWKPTSPTYVNGPKVVSDHDSSKTWIVTS